MSRFTLADFVITRNSLKRGVERVERLTALLQKLDAISEELVALDYYETQFAAHYDVECDAVAMYTVQDAIENLTCRLESGIRDAKDEADSAAQTLAQAIFGGDSND